MPGYFIVNAVPDDFNSICLLFEEAIQFQKQHNYTGWESYDKDYIKSDIEKGLLFKIVSDEGIICIFSICYQDKVIWREKEKGDAIYLHRIVLNQQFKGEKSFKKVLAWAIQFAEKKNLLYIRLDTWAENEKIIAYYKSYGFEFIENYTTPSTEDLPLQHRNLNVALLEMKLPPVSISENGMLHENVQDKFMEKVNLHQEFSKVQRYWDQKVSYR